MVKVAPEDPSSSTGTFLVSALSWVNSRFFLVGAAPLASEAPAAAGYASRASLVSPLMMRTPLLLGIFMRL